MKLPQSPAAKCLDCKHWSVLDAQGCWVIPHPLACPQNPRFNTRCDCCDLPAYSCGKAVDDERRRNQRMQHRDALERRGFIAAEYEGMCPRCHGQFAVGTPIKKSDDGWTEIDCWDNAP